MIDFMVIGLPRSGTTWLANWLTSADSYCLHDPLNKLHYEDWDNDNMYIPQDNRYRGVSCTGIWRWPLFLEFHPAKKLIIKRNKKDIVWSLRQKNFDIDLTGHDRLDEIMGFHVWYEDLFIIEHAKEIWNYLIGTEFDEQRYKMLLEMHVEPEFKKVYRNVNVAKRLHRE